MWSSHHQFQMIFLSQSRLFPCIIAFTMILYQMTLNLAWYINSYITFQIGTCPRPPRFDNHDEAWLCLGLAAFITLSWDNIAIMRALAMQWCTYRGSHHHHIPMYIPTHLFPLLRLMSLESTYMNNTNLNPEWRLLRGQKPYLGLVPVCSLPPTWHHFVHNRSPWKYINLFWNSFRTFLQIYTKLVIHYRNPLYSFETS